MATQRISNAVKKRGPIWSSETPVRKQRVWTDLDSFYNLTTFNIRKRLQIAH